MNRRTASARVLAISILLISSALGSARADDPPAAADASPRICFGDIDVAASCDLRLPSWMEIFMTGQSAASTEVAKESIARVVVPGPGLTLCVGDRDPAELLGPLAHWGRGIKICDFTVPEALSSAVNGATATSDEAGDSRGGV